MLKVLSTVTPKHLVIAAAVANVAEEMELTAFITAGSNGKHMKGSLHYSGNALDIRSKNIPKESKREFLKRVMKRLGSNYDGLLEDENLLNEHYHIEYDPK